MNEPSLSWLGASLALLRSLSGPMLVAILAVAGMIYIGSLLAHPERDVPTPVVGIITIVALSVVVLMALRMEGAIRNATPCETCRNKPSDS